MNTSNVTIERLNYQSKIKRSQLSQKIRLPTIITFRGTDVVLSSDFLLRLFIQEIENLC